MKGFPLARPPLWRMIVLAVAAWLVGSAVLLPGLNPLLRFAQPLDAEVGAMMGMVRFNIGQARVSAEEQFRRDGSWPADARAVDRPDDDGLLLLDFPAPQQMRFRFSQGFSSDTGLRGTALLWRFDPKSGEWQCRPGEPAPPSRWLLPECRPPSQGLGTRLVAVLIVVVLVATALLIWLGALDPAVRAVQSAPLRLRRLPVASLPGLDRRMRLLSRRAGALAAAEVAEEDWREALGYATADAERRAVMLAQRIGAAMTRVGGDVLPGPLFDWALPIDLPIALDRVLVLMADPAVLPRDLVRQLSTQAVGQDVLLVVSPSLRCDAALMAFAGDPRNLCVAVDQSSLSDWLLNPAPVDVFIALLARQLKITRISPYQTRGGVTRPAAFFGRKHDLARVIQREPDNYLLVGGRQLGKTSLLKAIERRFVGHSRVRCHYLSLRDHRLAPRLAQMAALAVDSPLEVSLRRLAELGGTQRLLLLIDETDLFLRDDARQGYAQLAQLRSLSEEGVCHFILAGFWDLYEAIALDFASPIRNFGEVIRLGGLEVEACRELATEPLRRLGVRFATDELVDRLVTACGQRANLVAMACQHALEGLERGERVISAEAIERALRCDAIADALAGWSRLTPEPRDCALDRAIVYRVAQCGRQAGAGLALADWMDELDAAAARVPAESVRRAFARLQLAFVLQRDESSEQWRFAVPLQALQFEAAEVDALLQRELRELGGNAAAP